MSIINIAHSQADAEARGTNVHRIDANHDGSVIVWTYETHHGLCIRDRERNGYDDSDWYMLVWDWAKMEPYEICFASTRGWSYPCYGSRPDATPEVMAAHKIWDDARIAQARAEQERLEALEPREGKIVRVVRGRKVPIGTEGKCTSRRDPNGYGEQVGILATGDNGKPALWYTAVKNVEVVQQS